MNYLKIYKQLIYKRRFISKLITYKKDPNYKYCEKHHIVPRCLGGSDNRCNLVSLLPREHYIAHLLLWKIVYQKYGSSSREYRHILHAIKMMRLNNNFQLRKFNINSRLYDKLKNKLYECGIFDIETRLQISKRMKGSGNPMYGLFGKDNPGYGSKRTLEQRKHMSDSQKKYFETHDIMKGKDHHSFNTTLIINIDTNETKSIKKDILNDFLNKNPDWKKYTRKYSLNSRKKMSESAKHKIVTDIHKQNISKGLSKMWKTEFGQKIRNQISNSMSKLIWIYNTVTNQVLRINPNEYGVNCKYNENNHWKKGRGNLNYLKGLMWINNPKTRKKLRVKKEDLSNYLKEGYIIGSATKTH